jgi:hypothetical protein
MQFDDRLLPGSEWFQPAAGSKRSSNCIESSNADVRVRTPDDVQKGCPKHVEA